MSRMRIKAKVRKNADYQAIEEFLNGTGLDWQLHPPTGKGHPYITIDKPGHETMRHTIACTPKGRISAQRSVSSLKRKMQEAGLLA